MADPEPADKDQKDTTDWKNDDEPATEAQQSYIETMADEVGEKIPEDLTKTEASKKIEDLREKTGRDS